MDRIKVADGWVSRNLKIPFNGGGVVVSGGVDGWMGPDNVKPAESRSCNRGNRETKWRMWFMESRPRMRNKDRRVDAI